MVGSLAPPSSNLALLPAPDSPFALFGCPCHTPSHSDTQHALTRTHTTGGVLYSSLFVTQTAQGCRNPKRLHCNSSARAGCTQTHYRTISNKGYLLYIWLILLHLALPNFLSAHSPSKAHLSLPLPSYYYIAGMMEKIYILNVDIYIFIYFLYIHIHILDASQWPDPQSCSRIGDDELVLAALSSSSSPILLFACRDHVRDISPGPLYHFLPLILVREALPLALAASIHHRLSLSLLVLLLLLLRLRLLLRTTFSFRSLEFFAKNSTSTPGSHSFPRNASGPTSDPTVTH